MDYRELSGKLKKELYQNIYFLHGEEEFVKDRLMEQIVTRRTPPMMPEFNLHNLSDATDQEIISACMAPPMLDDRTLVIVRGCPLFGNGEKLSANEMKQGTDRLTAYLDTMPPTVTLVFLERGKVNGNNRLKKYLAAKGAETLFDPLESGDAQAWIVADMKRRGLAMDREAASMLFFFVGPAMGDVAGELEKIALYVAPRTEVTEEDVQKVVEDRSSVRIFAFTDHLGMGRTDKAWETLAGVRRGDADAFQILSMTARQYRMLARYHQMKREGRNAADMKKELGVQDFVLRSLENQSRVTSLAIALRALDILLDGEEGLKTGRYRDEDLVMESVIAMITALYP